MVVVAVVVVLVISVVISVVILTVVVVLVAVVASPSLIDRTVSVDIKQHLKKCPFSEPRGHVNREVGRALTPPPPFQHLPPPPLPFFLLFFVHGALRPH